MNNSENISSLQDEDSMTIKSHREIKLLTFNFFMRPPGIKNNKSDFKDDRINNIGKKIKKFDIVCFQEMFKFFNNRKHKLKKISFSEGFKYYAENDTPGFFEGFMMGGGLLTISKHPIVKKNFYGFKSCLSIDKISKKGVLYTKINAFGSKIHLFNLHLQASYERFLGGKDNKSYFTRCCQMIELRNFIEKTLEEEDFKQTHNVIICGDFNVDANGYKVDIRQYQKKFLKEFQNFEKKSLFKEIDNDPKLEEDFVTEYDILIHVLSRGGKNYLKDHHRINHVAQGNKEKKMATLGDCRIDVLTGEKIAVEKFLTYKSIQGKWTFSIDYIFEFSPFNGGDKTFNFDDLDVFKNIQVKEGSCRVNPMEVEGRVYTHLSDHYGLECVLSQHDE